MFLWRKEELLWKIKQNRYFSAKQLGMECEFTSVPVPSWAQKRGTWKSVLRFFFDSRAKRILGSGFFWPTKILKMVSSTLMTLKVYSLIQQRKERVWGVCVCVCQPILSPRNQSQNVQIELYHKQELYIGEWFLRDHVRFRRSHWGAIARTASLFGGGEDNGYERGKCNSLFTLELLTEFCVFVDKNIQAVTWTYSFVTQKCPVTLGRKVSRIRISLFPPWVWIHISAVTNILLHSCVAQHPEFRWPLQEASEEIRFHSGEWNSCYQGLISNWCRKNPVCETLLVLLCFAKHFFTSKNKIVVSCIQLRKQWETKRKFRGKGCQTQVVFFFTFKNHVAKTPRAFIPVCAFALTEAVHGVFCVFCGANPNALKHRRTKMHQRERIHAFGRRKILPIGKSPCARACCEVIDLNAEWLSQRK